MTLDFLNDIFLLNLAFEAAQSAFERLAVLQMHFCQLELHHLPDLPIIAAGQNAAEIVA